MARHRYKVLTDNFTLGNLGAEVSLDPDEEGGPIVPALIYSGVLEPVGKAAKEAVEEVTP